MVFSSYQCLNIMYSNWNYPFLFVRHEKKLDFCTNEVCPLLKRNFDSQKEKGSNGFFAKAMPHYHVSQWNLPISLCPLKKKELDSCHKRNSSLFKDELWFPTKQRIFSWIWCINIVYPNGNYTFLFVHHKKKLDSCHK